MQVDYVQSFPNTPIVGEVYIKAPEGFQVEDGENNYYVINLHRNMYGQKQVGRVWYKYLTKNILMELGFTK